ncbi:MAG: Fic family protein [Candidatus Omnitrophica bacterium]|nr:Fic family protein [Candidatus Omnitrophota bacterium]MDD5736805.1 Fic family protein [Candidatus Omnitrophota bacterium]
MSIIESPPDYSFVFKSPDSFSRILKASQLPELQDLIRKANDRYFYWTDLAHRIPANIEAKPEEVWAYLKMTRSANMRNTPIMDKKGNYFTYWIPDCLHRGISEVDKWSGGQIITDQPFGLPSKERYIINSLMDEAIASSQLEGASTEYEVAKNMLRSGRKPKDKNEQMIVNNWNAMQFIRENKKKPFSMDRLFELHTILTLDTLESPSQAGRFRETDDISVTYRDEVVHIPLKAEMLKERIEKLIEFASNDDEENWVHPVIKGAMIHFWLGYDHPFIDGNGRTARALMYWYLLGQGYELFQYLSISKHFLRAPGQYVRAYLYTESDENDLTYFLYYNLLSIRFALNDLRKYFKSKQHEISKANDLLNKFRGLNLRQKSLIYHSIQHPDTIYTIETHKNTQGIAYDTARKDLMALVLKDFLKMEKQGRRLLLFHPTEKIIDKLSNK